MENGPFEDVFPIRNGDIPFHCYVSLPEGICIYIYILILYIYICMLDQELFKKSYQRSFFAESVQMVRTRLVT